MVIHLFVGLKQFALQRLRYVTGYHNLGGTVVLAS